MPSLKWLRGLLGTNTNHKRVRPTCNRRLSKRRTPRLEAMEERRVLAADPGWAFNIGGAGYDEAKAVVADETGDVYVTGHFQGTVDFDQFGSAAGASTVLTAIESDDIFVAAYKSNGEIKWVTQLGGASADRSSAIVLQGSHVYVAGHDGDGSGILKTFLAKLDTQTGTEQQLNWNPQFTVTGGASAADIAVDNDGSIYLTGDLLSATDFGDGNFIAPAGSTGSMADQYVVKLNASGSLEWATTTGTHAHQHIGEFGIDVDNAGNVYVVGSDRYDSGYFGGIPIGNEISVVAQIDASTGGFKWAKSFGTDDGGGAAGDVTVDSLGNLYITGLSSASSGLLTYDGVSVINNPGSSSVAYLLKVNSAGVVQWGQVLGDAPGYGQEVVVDADGSVHFTGWFQGTATLAPGMEITSTGGNDTFVATVDPSDGTFLAVETAGTTLSDGAYGMAVDGNGNLILAGSFGGGTMVFPEGDLVSTAGDRDSFMWKLGQRLVEITPSGTLFTSEEGGTTSFQVVLTQQPTAPVTLQLESLDMGEGTIVGAVDGILTLTFNDTDYDVPQTVTVMGENDTETDGDVSFVVDLATASSADPLYDGVDAGHVQIVNLDDETNKSTFSNNTQISINDAKGQSPGVTTSTIEIAESGTILDLNLQLDITHPYDGQLAATLIAPDGTRAELFSGVGGAGDNFKTTIFDDQAAESILTGSAPFLGSYRPAEPLSSFIGTEENLSGTWTLEILDSAKFQVGTLNSWSITALYAPVIVPNLPPTAVDDTASTSIDTPVVISFNDLLANDTDPNAGDTLSVTGVDDTATVGDVVDNLDGTVTYTPALGFIGTDAFTYTIDDGNGATATASVTVTVIDPAAEQTYVSIDTPLSIEDPHKKHGERTITSEIDIGTIGLIASLSIDLDIDHADKESLEVKLMSSSGDMIFLQYLDGAWVYDPSLFLGTELSGTWTLSITDLDSDRITGTLNSWSLTASVEATAALDAAMAELGGEDPVLGG